MATGLIKNRQRILGRDSEMGADRSSAGSIQVYFPDTGLYVAGALTGLTDVDAIALSMANLAGQDPASSGAAARTIVIAVISNTMVNCGMTIWLGAPSMRRTMIPITVALALAGVGAALLVG